MLNNKGLNIHIVSTFLCITLQPETRSPPDIMNPLYSRMAVRPLKEVS